MQEGVKERRGGEEGDKEDRMSYMHHSHCSIATLPLAAGACDLTVLLGLTDEVEGGEAVCHHGDFPCTLYHGV